MTRDEWTHRAYDPGGGAWVRVGTAGPSIFLNLYSNGIQTLGLEDAKSLRDWLNDAIERMSAWEAQY